MRWAKNYERLQEIQRQLMWPPVTDFDHRIFIPEVSSLIIAQTVMEQTDTYVQHAHSRTVVRVSRRIKIMHVYIERTLRACT